MPSSTDNYPLSLHDALPICQQEVGPAVPVHVAPQCPGHHAHLAQTGRHLLRSEEHTSELQSLRHLVCRLPPTTTLFPYTTLFRSVSRRSGQPSPSTSLHNAPVTMPTSRKPGATCSVTSSNLAPRFAHRALAGERG